MGSSQQATIPDGITEIDQYAFKGCTTLTSVTIPDGVTKIGWYAFEGCTVLTSITIPNSVTMIGRSAFKDCTSLTSVTIPDSVTEISHDAFERCNSLKSVYLGNCTDWVPSSPLLESITVSEANEKYSSVDGILYSKDGTKLVKFPAAYPAAEFTIPDGVTTIGRSAFSGCTALTSIMYNALTENGYSEAKKIFMSVPEFAAVINSDNSNSCAAEETPKTRYDELIAGDADGYQRKLLIKENFSSVPAEIRNLKYSDIDETWSEDVMNYLLTAYVMQKKPAFDAAADEIAAHIDIEKVKSAIWKRFIDYPKLMLLFARYADNDEIDRLISMKRTWHSWYDYGQKGRQAEEMIPNAILLSDTRSAMLYCEKNGLLNDYAKLRRTDADTIRDTKMLDFGLDVDGKKTYDIGGTTITAYLGNDLKIALYDEKAGKVVKSIPKRGNDEGLVAKASDDLSELKKNIKKAVKIRNDQLFDVFLNGSELKAASWKASYLGNAVLKCVARLIVWEQGGSTFILSGNDIVDSSGNKYTITNKAIRVAHPMEMTTEDIAAWQEYFCKNGLKQPFEQIWEPAYKQENITADRYKDMKVDVREMMNKGKHGIDFEDDNFHETLHFRFDYSIGCTLDYDCIHDRHSLDGYFELGKFTIAKMDRKTNHIIYILDKMTLKKRIIEDDIKIVDMLSGYTAAQITEFIAIASEHNSVNCLAALIDYKNAHFTFASDFDEFILD